MSIKEMCDRIAERLSTPAHPMTSRDVWEMSPTGELWPIVALYQALFDHGA